MKEGSVLSRRDFISLAGFSASGLVLTAFVPEGPPTPEKVKETSIIITGDVMLGRFVTATSESAQNLNYPFLKVADTLRDADLVFVNLEHPVIEACPPTELDEMKLCADPKMLSGLNEAGVDVVTIANNHILDYQEAGLAETKKHLQEAGILYTLKELAVKEVNGTRFGFLGMNFFEQDPTEADYQLVREAKSKVDVLILGIHWGVEFQEPLPVQREWAEKLVDAGADIIAGSHPHRVQEMEYIKGVPVFYSLGNFIFDQMYSVSKRGLAVRLTFRGSELVGEEQLTSYLTSWGQPEFISP